ncbi:MAG: hypothetical protein ACFFCH_03770 [Promethearchaeota archaeon]
MSSWPDKKISGEIKGPYKQLSVKKRIEAFFLDNIGKVVTSDMLRQVARDPKTDKARENWHQRLSELRTDEGYTILSWRDSKTLTRLNMLCSQSLSLSKILPFNRD